ncbi:glyoxalase/bleomycin resistance/extradiol dioxygenase family protein [Marmoricola sp. URHB0036]|uniref:VOC family protein n=1 Tax=Marmoricola sp. URHB0036 TaxID=1298863 RepID=UPI0004108617|nr:VOC family protein [Marmoricola sp. URHB0036]
MYDPSRGYPVVVPCLLYDDPPAASAWLVESLGFREILRATLPDGWTGHVELERDGFIVLLGRKGGQFAEGAGITQVFVDDVAAACERGVAGGGTLLDPAGERPWGVLQAVLADPEGQRWLVTSHVRDTDPADWYGTVLGPMPG